ncbi:GAF domain-containing protein [Meridianimarinicoccus sp. RP-17]|uniref:GAF domain-containing protein n=1 Tax=Meridianimarinicoccus zhengii TaxID=2056810 RepID=UPI0013A6C8E9|nr:GAF domain-containing protein [Phycocomes zhengii]
MAAEADYPIGPHEFQRLRKLGEAGFAGSEHIPALDALCAEAKAHFGVKMAAVTLLTEEVQLLKARVGIDATETPRNVAFCNYTILDDRVFVVRDTLEDPRFSEHPLTRGAPFLRFYAGAPLLYLAELRLGAFCLLDTKPRDDFSDGEQAELIDFAERAVQVLVDRLARTGP